MGAFMARMLIFQTERAIELHEQYRMITGYRVAVLR